MRPVLIVHGGAGNWDPARAEHARTGCARAVSAAWEGLRAGGSAVDAVETAVSALEDDPQFNAGTGAVLNSTGGVQLDASIMDGATLAAGAVAAVNRIRNPVRLARRLMDDGRHVLLVAEGAHRYAVEAGQSLCEERTLIIPGAQTQTDSYDGHGTVGAVALDLQGRLAAATSTGGRAGSLPGRVGDSPLIGCGTYANGYGAVSCTGVGEAIIRVGLARSVVERLRGGQHAEAAVLGALAEFARLTGSEAGIIAIDVEARIAHACNATAMPIAYTTPGGEIVTGR